MKRLACLELTIYEIWEDSQNKKLLSSKNQEPSDYGNLELYSSNNDNLESYVNGLVFLSQRSNSTGVCMSV